MGSQDRGQQGGHAKVLRSRSRLDERNVAAQQRRAEGCTVRTDCETIYLDWDGVGVSKEEAKKYVREYR